MGEAGQMDEFPDLPFHEYCANCKTRFDESVLEPSVTIVETDEQRALHSFCDDTCLAEWAPDKTQ